MKCFCYCQLLLLRILFFLFFMYVNFFVAKLEFVKDQIKYIINGTWTAKQVFCEMKTVKGSNQCNEYIKVKFAMQPQYLNALWKRGRTIILQLLCWIVIQFGVRSMAETLLDEWVFSQLEFLLDFEPHSVCLFLLELFMIYSSYFVLRFLSFTEFLFLMISTLS